MIVYFSGTGNSRQCAQLLAQTLQDEMLDASNYIRHGIGADLHSGKPWVFVAPTYSWQLPKVFQSFLASGCFEGAEEAYFVMTCGFDIGAPEETNRELCRQKGLRYQGTLQVVMPENYIALFLTYAVGVGTRLKVIFVSLGICATCLCFYHVCIAVMGDYHLAVIACITYVVCRVCNVVVVAAAELSVASLINEFVKPADIFSWINL